MDLFGTFFIKIGTELPVLVRKMLVVNGPSVALSTSGKIATTQIFFFEYLSQNGNKDQMMIVHTQ